MLNKIKLISFNAFPILGMIGCIPIIWNDYILTLIYLIITILSLWIHYEKNDILFYVVGFLLMLIFESIFILTGVEVFQRNSLFGIMPLWLPFLWAYGFIAIKRTIRILD